MVSLQLGDMQMHVSRVALFLSFCACIIKAIKMRGNHYLSCSNLLLYIYERRKESNNKGESVCIHCIKRVNCGFR